MGKMTCAHDIWHPHWVWTLAKLAIFPIKKTYTKTYTKKTHELSLLSPKDVKLKTCPLGTQSLHHLHMFCQILWFSKRCPTDYRFFRIRIPLHNEVPPSARSAVGSLPSGSGAPAVWGKGSWYTKESLYDTNPGILTTPNEGKWDTLPETNQMPLKIGRAPKGKAKVFLLTLISRRELLGFSRRVANRKIPVLLSPSWFRYEKYIHVSTPIWTNDHNFRKPTFSPKRQVVLFGGWWFQPTWKICSSSWMNLPQGFGVKIPKIFEGPPTSFGGI